jgi:hypothetical protein
MRNETTSMSSRPTRYGAAKHPAGARPSKCSIIIIFANKIGNRGDWTLDKKLVCRASRLQRDMLQWTQNVGGLAEQHGQMWDARYISAGYDLIPPPENELWAIP